MKKGLCLLLAACTIFAHSKGAKCGLVFYYDERGVLHITNAAPRLVPRDKKPLRKAIPLTRIKRIWHLIVDASRATGLDPLLLASLVIVESMGDPHAVSHKGAKGLTQLMPETARELGVDPEDPRENLMGGAWYLRSLLERFNGDLILALAAYNAGPGVVSKVGAIPHYSETSRYVRQVLITWKQLQVDYAIP